LLLLYVRKGTFYDISQLPMSVGDEQARPDERGERVLRVLVADDHPAIIDAVATFLADEDDVELVARASDGEEALALIERRSPDVAVLDIRMPRFGGIEILRKLADVEAPPPVVLYTGYPERNLLLDSLDAGARAFLRKEAPLADLLRAIRTVAAGGTYIDPMLAGVLASPSATDRLPALSKREREILRMLADGMRNDRVASMLSISPLTVQSHVKNAMEKLEADTRTQAVASALRQSLIT
jgi:DNA-binding NarL/FixJ family response regulator